MGLARPVVRNTLALSAGQLGTRALTIVYVAALARHIHTDGMGALATSQSLGVIVALLIGLGHDTLAIREIAARPHEATAWLWDLLGLRVVLSVAGLIGLALFSRLVDYPPETSQVVLVYGLVTVVGALLSVPRNLIQARELLALEAAVQFGRDVANIVLSVIAIALGASLLTIVWISVLANLGQLAVELAIVARRKMATWGRPSPARIRAIFRGGIGIGLVVLCSIMYAQVGTILLSLLAGPTATGTYAAAYNLLLVLLIVPDMFQRAVFPVFARLHADPNRNLGEAYEQSLRALTAVALPLAIGTFLVAEPAIGLLYGPDFAASVAPLRVLCAAVAVTASYASGAILIATGQQRRFALTTGAELFVQVALAVALIPIWGPLGATIGYAVPRVIAFFGYLVWCHRLLRRRPRLAPLLRIALASLIMGAVVVAALQAGVHWLWLACLIGPLAYGLALLALGELKLADLRLLGRGRLGAQQRLQ
ncbi:MAG TPA: flippase [Chloroflexota bacterium]